jgi:hypothetical protein
LLGDPSAGWVGRATGEVDAAALEFDEEEHVEAAQRDRLELASRPASNSGTLGAPDAEAQEPEVVEPRS